LSRAGRQFAEQHEWIAARLLQEAVAVHHDGSDDVDDLRQARDLDDFRPAKEDVHPLHDDQRIFQLVGFFQQVRRFQPDCV
jgi:hypothetical protein